MSINAINWALQQPLKGCQKFVLTILAYHANDEGKCWPGLELISQECGITRSSTISHINHLVNLGLVTKTKRFDNKGFRRSTLYQLNITDMPIIQSLKSQRRKNQRRDFENQGPDFDTSNVQNLDGNIIERSLEQSKEPTAIVEVFSYWQEVLQHPKAKLDKKRNLKIKEALKLYSVADLKLAIDGCAASKFHMGENKNKRKYDGIDLIFRDADRIETFMSFANNLNITNTTPIDWVALAM